MEKVLSAIQLQRDFYASGRTKSYEARRSMLLKLREAIVSRESELLAALKRDLNKGDFEAYSTEIGITLAELSHTLRHLKKWMKPKRMRTPMTHFGARSYVMFEPYGVSLIIAPWNYPVQLTLVPLIAAVAAGNTALVKPSELSPSVSNVLTSLINDTFEPGWAVSIEGGIDVSTALLEQRFDKIFFTGSVAVGKIVMAAAAKHLTPITLELGGKSPCIVHQDANVALAAKRIAFGKFTNAGQTCIAPDYVYVHHSVKEKFMKEMEKAITELYGSDPLRNPNYVHIISEKHYDRLVSFMKDGRTSIGGEVEQAVKGIAPTLLEDVDWSSPIMQEEIFGPLLPVMDYRSIEDVVAAVNARPKPLALYLFSESGAVQEEVLSRIPFGGGCVNDTIMHVGTPYLPFGGVGESGIGSYHGDVSFEAFSHQKSVLKQTTLFDMPFRYPNSKMGSKLIRKLLK